jgi:hypothetical protein
MVGIRCGARRLWTRVRNRNPTEVAGGLVGHPFFDDYFRMADHKPRTAFFTSQKWFELTHRGCCGAI